MLEEISEKNFTPEGRIEIFHREIDESFPGARRKRERGWIMFLEKTERERSANKNTSVFFLCKFDISPFFSIKGIDFFTQVCYTKDKLENKINILTNNKQNKKEKKWNLCHTKKNQATIPSRKQLKTLR